MAHASGVGLARRHRRDVPDVVGGFLDENLVDGDGAWLVAHADAARHGATKDGRPTDAAAHSVFFLATGFHGLHVIGGIVAFWFILARSYMTRTHTHEQTVGAHVVSYYWHFVDVVWIALFAMIYILQ